MTVRYVVGGILVVVGLVSLLLGGFRWTEEKTVLDVGPVKATAALRPNNRSMKSAAICFDCIASCHGMTPMIDRFIVR